MQGCICKCNKCGNKTITTNRVHKEIIKCGCGGILKSVSKCNIGIDLVLACNDITATIPVVKHGDTIVVQPMYHIRREDCKKYVAELAALPPNFEIVGVIKNG